LGSIVAIFAFSCGFEEIFVAIGFGGVEVVVVPPVDVVVDVVVVPEGFEPLVVDVDFGLAPCVEFPVVLGAELADCACVADPAPRPC